MFTRGPGGGEGTHPAPDARVPVARTDGRRGRDGEEVRQRHPDGGSGELIEGESTRVIDMTMAQDQGGTRRASAPTRAPASATANGEACSDDLPHTDGTAPWRWRA
ncbi:hypothetical protein GCM10022227_55470 [Streptomyces sedi]